MEQELGFGFISNHPDKEGLNIFEAFNGIFRITKQLSNQLMQSSKKH